MVKSSKWQAVLISENTYESFNWYRSFDSCNRWFGINKNKPVIRTPKPSFSKFWRDRVKILEEELVRLNRESKDKAVALARKIDHQYGHIYFALRDDGNSLQEDPTFQNNALDRFCNNSGREKIGDALDKKLCGNIDYEHLD